MTLFICRLLITTIFTRRLSDVLSKISHNKNNFRSGVPLLEGVTRGGPRPFSDATVGTEGLHAAIGFIYSNNKWIH